LRWALEAGHIETGLFTAGRVWRFWLQRGHLGEGLAMTRDLLACPEAQGRTAARAKALDAAGGLAYWQNDFEAAGRDYGEELAIVEELGDQAGVAEARHNLGYLAAVAGDYDLATQHYERALELWREVGNRIGEASGVGALALVLFLRKDYAQALVVGREAVARTRESGDRYRWASMLGLVGRVSWALGGDPTALALQFDDLGEFAFDDGDPARALQLAGAAAAVRKRVAGGAPPQLTRHGDYVADARKALPAAEADAAWRAGQSLEEAVAIADALGDWRLFEDPT